MSGIFGLFHKDGAPVDPVHLETMAAPMARMGPDGGGLWSDGPCGLGQVLLFNTPEALHERMPQAVDGGRLAITAESRVDNRDELCDFFDIPAAERPITPDGELILRAYLHWGEACPHHIYGDWSFAVWDPAQRRLFLARDQHGATALYYIDTPHFLAFASSLKALLVLTQHQPRLNESKFADCLAYSGGNPEETFYAGILHLLPAHTLTVTPQRMEIERYWVLEDAPEVRLPTEEAYVEGLREMLERTVRSQVRSYHDVGLSLSGGLDSGGLAAIAAPILGEQGRSLFAYTATPVSGETVPTGVRVADESPWTRAIVHHVGNIRDQYADFAQTSPVAAIQQTLEIHDEPRISWANSFWLLGFCSLAQEQGVGVLLNGYMGNATASWQGLLRSQPWPVLLRNGHWKGGLRDKVLSRLPYAALRHLKRQQLGKKYWQEWMVIRPEFAQRMRLEERLAVGEHDLRIYAATRKAWAPQHQLLSAREQRLQVIQPGRWIGGGWQGTLSAWYGVETRIPLADARLMAYCLGIPDRYFYNGMMRGLYRRALAGRLPKEILENKRRGLQGADLVTRLRMHRADVEQSLALVQGESIVTNYIDLTRLQEAWATVCATNIIDDHLWKVARMFMHGLACSLYLRRLTYGTYDDVRK